MIKRMTKEQTKEHKIPAAYWIILIVIGVAALAAGSIWDLPIDQALYNPNAAWAQFFVAYGPAPLYWSLETAGLIMVLAHAFDDSRFHTAITVFGWIALAFGVLFSLGYAIKKGVYPTWVAVLLSLIIFEVPSWMFYRLVRGSSSASLRRLVYFLLGTSLLPYALTFVLKNVMRRPRYIALLGDPRLTFQPWWELTRRNLSISTQAIANPDLFYSFPSGHTASASALLGFAVLPQYNSRVARWRWAVYTVIPLGIAVVAFSRMVLGYHFLSDVSFAFLLATVIAVLLYEVIYGRRARDNHSGLLSR